MFSFAKPADLPTADTALKGRQEAIPTAATHYVNGKALKGPYPEGLEVAEFGMGCFWGVERIFWQVPGVYVTAVGYSGGITPNATYEEACSGRTGHAETVLVVFDPTVVTYAELLKTFWEGHDPTQGMRQGGDRGTQYRSAIYTHSDAQLQAAKATAQAYGAALKGRGFGPVTTEIKPAGGFYFAEGYHQQYLAKNPGGYCGIGGTGVDCPAGVGVDA